MATVNIVKRKKKLASNEYPITIRVSVKGSATAYIRIDGMSCIESEWNDNLSRFKRNKYNYKELNSILFDIETKIDSITSKLLARNEFSITHFKDLYFGKKDDDNVVNNFVKKINELKQLDKIGTANFYNDSMNAFIGYAGNKETVFNDIDYSFLTGYRNKQLLKGNKLNTVAVYFRGLRSLHYAYCTKNKLNRPSAYLEVGIKTEATRHRALTREQLQKLQGYTCKSSFEQRTINIFFASFYMRGINLIDLSKLTKQSIVNNRIEYSRSKTSSLFSIPITKDVQTILDYFKDDSSKYLFPIIKNGNNIKNEVRIFNRIFNRILQRISLSLNLPNVTYYFARHSFASILKSNKVGIEQISQLLGHSDLKTTQIYLTGFENKELDAVTNNILTSIEAI